MARIRTIKPEFSQSESMGRVSREARLLFILLWTFVDDSGKARANSRVLASVLYPFDTDAIDRIDGWLVELEHEGCVVFYEVQGVRYLQISKWNIHQKIDRPSKSRFPEFREDSRVSIEASMLDLGPRTMDLVPRKEQIPCRAQGSTGGEGSQEKIASGPADKPKRQRKEPSPDGMKHSSDPRHIGCKEWIGKYWARFNQDQMPWDGAEGKALAMLLHASPTLTPERMHEMLRNRAKSEGVPHSERPSRWIGQIHKYANGPLDRFGKLKGGNNGIGISKDKQTIRAVHEALGGRAQDYLGLGDNGDVETSDSHSGIPQGPSVRTIEGTVG